MRSRTARAGSSIFGFVALTVLFLGLIILAGASIVWWVGNVFQPGLAFIVSLIGGAG